MERGDVIRVRDWPNTVGDRFEVEKVIPHKDPNQPRSVYAYLLEKMPKGGVIKTKFRAFPEDRCEVVK